LQELESKSSTGVGKAALANLRRGIGKQPGELPELWGVLFENIPEELTATRGMTDAEWAIYTALTLFALHKQGSDGSVNVENISVGAAAAHLVKEEDDKERILKRLNIIATAVSKVDMAYHLRGLISLLKNDGIALDYAKLAKDLYVFCNPEWANDVKLNWGRDFYKELSKMRTKGEDNNE
jgi:CRISPR system Cascade subunit CasB